MQAVSGISRLVMLGMLGVITAFGACSGIPQKDIDAVKQQLTVREQETAAAREQLAAKDQELAAARQHLAAKVQEAGNLGKDLQTAKEQMEASKSRVLKAEDDLTKLRAEIEKSRPKLPQPAPLSLDPGTTALLVLDLSNRVNDPAQVASRVAPPVRDFLSKTRAARVLTIYTISASAKDTPQGKIWDGFAVLPDEPVLWPDAFDKFNGGEIRDLLQKRGIKTVIITGASTNFAVLYTATTAARIFGYNVVIPVDGVISNTQYEDDYALYQFTRLPGGAAARFSFTTLGGIEFR